MRLAWISLLLQEATSSSQFILHALTELVRCFMTVASSAHLADIPHTIQMPHMTRNHTGYL